MMTLIDPVQLCPDCQIVRTPRSRHCGTCNQCVERFDHHCPWVNNCIGIKNHGIFLTFIFLMTVNIIYNLVLAVLTIADTTGITDIQDYQIPLHYMILSEEITRNLLILRISQGFTIFLTLFFSGPILLLIYVQLRNFFSNRTTNERLGGKKYGKEDSVEDTTESNPSSYSATTSLLADEFIKEIGEPEDYSNRKAECIFNFSAMCCKRKMPDQQDIYDHLMNTMESRHKSSIAGLDDFKNRFYTDQSVARGSYHDY